MSSFKGEHLHELDQLIKNTEFENSVQDKAISAEQEKISAFEKELSKLIEGIDGMEREMMENESLEMKCVQKIGQYKENYESLKKTSTVLDEHIEALNKKAETTRQLALEQRLRQKEAIDKYQPLWMSYKKKYESSELAQKYLVLSQDLSFLEEENRQLKDDMSSLKQTLKEFRLQDSPIDQLIPWIIEFANYQVKDKKLSQDIEELDKGNCLLTEDIEQTKREIDKTVTLLNNSKDDVTVVDTVPALSSPKIVAPLKRPRLTLAIPPQRRNLAAPLVAPLVTITKPGRTKASTLISAPLLITGPYTVKEPRPSMNIGSSPVVSKPSTASSAVMPRPSISSPMVSRPTISAPIVSRPNVSSPVVFRPSIVPPVVFISPPVVSRPSTLNISPPVVSRPLSISPPVVSRPSNLNISTPVVSRPSTQNISFPVVSRPSNMMQESSSQPSEPTAIDLAQPIAMETNNGTAFPFLEGEREGEGDVSVNETFPNTSLFSVDAGAQPFDFLSSFPGNSSPSATDSSNFGGLFNVLSHTNEKIAGGDGNMFSFIDPPPSKGSSSNEMFDIFNFEGAAGNNNDNARNIFNI